MTLLPGPKFKKPAGRLKVKRGWKRQELKRLGRRKVFLRGIPMAARRLGLAQTPVSELH